MRVLMVDNYDSFTYNLVQYLGELGADLEVVRNDVTTVDELLAQRLRPRRRLARPVHAQRGGDQRRGDAPLPGGGREDARRLPRATSRSGRRSAARSSATSRSTARRPRSPTTARTSSPACRSPLPVARYHSLVVDEDLPECLEATAHGGGVLMAMRHRTLPALGVQFHPESVLTPDGKQLLKNFLA